jgi:hypothetical protein
MTEYQAKEFDLIDKYIILKKRISHLEMVKSAYGKDFSNDDANELNELFSEKEIISNELISLQEKPATKNKIATITGQINAIIGSLNDGPYGYKISRSQGLLYDTAIYGYIIRDIEHSLNNYYGAWHIPSYYYSAESNFDHNPIKEYLKSFVVQINSNTAVNFVELSDQIENCVKYIKELCDKDYKENFLKK